MEDEHVRRLAEARSYIARRIEELENEIKVLRLLLDLVNAALSRESFTRASELAPAAAAPRPGRDMGELVSELTISSRSGRELARFEVYERGVVIRPLIEVPLDTPPFRSFFVAKILEGYRRKDEELVKAGRISEDEAFDYELDEEGGIVREIRVYNYRERRRLDELRSALRWTLNRVLERMR